MKKTAYRLVALCVIFSLFAISAFALPTTHTLPTVIDFEDEGLSNNGEKNLMQPYWPTSNNAYSIKGAMRFHKKNNNTYLSSVTPSGVDGQALIKFEPFAYDNTVAVGQKQPKLLVVSFDAKYADVDRGSICYNEIIIGTGTLSGEGINGSLYSFLNSGSLSLFFDHDSDTGKYGQAMYTFGSGVRAFSSGALNYHAYLDKILGNGTLNYKFVFDLSRYESGDYQNGSVVIYIDDAKTDKIAYESIGLSAIDSILLGASKDAAVEYDNIKIYTIDNAPIQKVSASIDGATDVPIYTDSVTVTFSHEITDLADQYIVVKKGDEPLTSGVDYTIEHIASEGVIKSAESLKISFSDSLSYDSTYTIEAAPGYFGIDGSAIGETMQLSSFTTESTPQISISNVTLKKGFFASEPITLAEAVGKTVTVTATIANAESKTVGGTIFFGVYKNGVLYSCGLSSRMFALGESEIVTATLNIPEISLGDVIEIKVFPCESYTNLYPYTTPTVFTTAE